MTLQPARAPRSAGIAVKKSFPSRKTGMNPVGTNNPIHFPPPFCEAVEKSLLKLATWLRYAEYRYSCATAPELHRFRSKALPSGVGHLRSTFMQLVEQSHSTQKRKKRQASSGLRAGARRGPAWQFRRQTGRRALPCHRRCSGAYRACGCGCAGRFHQSCCWW